MKATRKPARCPDTGRSLKSFCDINEDFSLEEKAVLVSGTLEDERGPTFLRRQERALSPGTWDFTIADDPRPVKVEPKKLESP